MIISYKDKKTPLIRNYSSPASLMTPCEKGIKKTARRKNRWAVK